MVDKGMNDIAKEFRFTVEEVQEYFVRCGDMGRTRGRFEAMRAVLTERFKD